MAFDAAKARELMESERAKREQTAAAETAAQQGTTWTQDRMDELNTEIADSTPEETYTFDPEESRAQFNALGDLAVTVARDTIDADIEYAKAEANYEATGSEEDEQKLEDVRKKAIAAPFKEPAKQFMNAYADDSNSPFQGMAQGLRQSSANLEYFMTPDEKLEMAHRINQRLPMIPTGAMLSSTEAMQGALFAYDMAKKMDDVGGDMESVYQQVPALRTICEKDSVGAALALKDIKHVLQAKDLVDSIYSGWKHGDANYEYGVLKMKEAYEGLTDDERDEMEKLEKTLKETEQYYPSFFVDPWLAMAGGIESLPEMAYTFGRSLLYGTAGAVVGAAIAGVPTYGAGAPAGAMTGFTWGRRAGMAYEMFRPMMGRKFAEYQEMKDANGAPLMTRSQARTLAAIEAVPEALIETGGFEFGFLKNLSGEGFAKEAVENIVKNGRSAISAKTFEDFMRAVGKDLTIGTAREAVSEAGEEFLQEYPDAIVKAYIQQGADVKNAAELGVPKNNMGEAVTAQQHKNMDFSLSRLSDVMENVDWGDITKRAVAQGAEAIPGSIFLGGLSSVGGIPVGGISYGIERTSWARKWGEMAKTERTTVSGAIMLDQLQKTVQDSKLKDTAPEVQQEIIRDQVKDTPWQMAWIDVKSALKNENGEADVREAARAAGIDEDRVEKAIADGGSLMVPVECYAQSKASQKLLDSVSFSQDAEPMAVMRENAQKISEDYRKRIEGSVKKQVELTEAMTNELFPNEGEERDAAMAAIYQNPENPAQGWKELYDHANAELDEIIAPAVAALDSGMGQGTSVVETVNEIGEVSSGRASNNAEWYREWYKEHKRPPTQQEKRDMAKLMVMGDVNAPQVQGWRPTTGEEAAAMESSRERVTALENEINTLDNIKERMQTLNGTEIKLTEGLSPEAYKVYRAINSSLRGIGGKQARAARINALMMARHADVVTERMHGLGYSDYTALDYLKNLAIQRGMEIGAAEEAYNQQAVNQQMEEVRRQYEGTDQWMKAPNGQPTKLTEEQWLIVRTPAFKAWFGDWEAVAEAYPTMYAVGRNDVQEIIQSLRNKKLKSDAENIEATFNHRALGHLTSSGAVANSQRNGFTAEDHFTAVANIEKLFANSIKSNEREDDNHDIKGIEHFSSLFMIKNTPALATFTVKVTNNAGRKIYTIEVMELKKAEGKVLGTALKLHKPKKHPQAASAFDILNISQIAEKYNSISKVVDENGEPMPTYHGTKRGLLSRRFTEFDGQGRPVWHSESKDYAGRYSDNKKWYETGDIYEDFLNIKNPINIGDVGFGGTGSVNDLAEILGVSFEEVAKIFGVEDTDEKTARLPYSYIYQAIHSPEFVEWAKKKGYDGIIEVESGTRTFGTFNPTQVKSATDNNGQFSVNDPNIYHQQGSNIVDVLNQSAWHGSPHSFDSFDLGAIGTGEGAQVHGWGLYFAQDQEVAKRYRENLVASRGGWDYRVTVNGERVSDEIKDVLDRHSINYLYRESQNGPEVLKREIKNIIKTLRGQQERGLEVYLRRLVKTLEGEIKRIDENPKMSITAYLKTLPEEEKSRLKQLVDSARREAKGRRTNIQDVKRRLEQHLEPFAREIRDNEADADVLESLDLDNLKIERESGSLFEVDIPENDVMLDEQKYLSEQPPKVQAGVKATIEDIVDEYFDGQTVDEFVEDVNRIAGKEVVSKDSSKEEVAEALYNGLMETETPQYRNVYRTLTTLGPTPRDLSLLLNKHGVEGITYDGRRDGRCYVVFDDKAISIIESYNQKMNGFDIQGRTLNYSDGRRLVELFESADESTFLHETGHIFLKDLEMLAGMGDETSIADLQIVNGWAEWHDGDAAKYKNTPWYEEFAEREKQIKAARKSGDTKKEEQLLREWKQERFARAFEIYLYEGKAPSKGLRHVFEKFVDFLTQIYNVFKTDGAKASEQVEAVMSRLVATEDEIAAAELDDRYEKFEAAGGAQLLEEDAKETFDRWHEEAKQEAQDRLRRIVMRDLKKRAFAQREKFLQDERAQKEEELSNQPVYLARQAIEETKIKDAWKAYFPNKEEWEKANATAPPMENVLDAYVKDVAAVYDADQIQNDLTEETVEAAMSEAPYHERLVDLERQAFAAKAALVNNLSGRAKNSMDSVQKMISDLSSDESPADNAELQDAINGLSVSTRWSREEMRAIDNLAASKTKEEALKNYDALHKLTEGRKVGISDLREANRGRIEILKNIAKDTIARQTLTQATQVQTHRTDERNAAKDAKKYAKQKNWQEAARAKERELFASFMASEAQKTRDRMLAIVKKIKRQLNAKTKLPKDERYWHQHLSYLLRITDKDAEIPAGLESIQALAVSMGQGLDVVTDEDGQSDIIALLVKLADPNTNKDGYRGMTLNEFEDAADALTALYVTGRDKFNMKTVKGKTVSDVVEEILQDSTAYNGARVQQSKITGNPNRGGVFWNEMLARIPGAGDTLAQYAQRYGLSLTKPEELINLLGQKAHRYLYDTYDRAAEQEASMTADFVSGMQSILSKHYTAKELRDWQARVYNFKGEPLSKENVLAMAMNMGNDINMDRLIMGLGTNAETVEQFLTENMTEKDWLFCQDVWDLLSTYWPDTVRVEMELNGTRLKPQTARAFTVQTKDAKGNNVSVELRGGYYPIKYDPEKSMKAGEQAENALARSGMSGAMVLGMGRGFTKDRAAKGAIVDRPLLLSLSVIPEHCGEAIHNISTRIAARDVYRLINDNTFRQYVESTLGIEAYKVLRTWATDVWNVKPEQGNGAESFANQAIRSLRQNSGIAIMGYRMWPTIENATNIFPMMDALGATETMSALSDYYANKAEFDELIAKSMFMKERTERMERDMKGQRNMFEKRNAVSEWLVEHAYDPITFTDLLTSKPLWARAYKNAFPTELENLRKENEENAATFDARRAEFEALNAEIIDMRNRRTALQEEIKRRNLQQAVQAETDLTQMSRAEINDEIKDLDRRISEKGREVFIAGEKMQRASQLVIRTEKEMLDEAEHRSILVADKAVREVIGSGDVKDQSEVQRSRNEMVKALTMFYSYFNTQANAIIQAHWRGKWQGGQGYNFLPLAKAIVYRFMLTAALSTAMRWVFFSEGDDDKDKYKKDKEGNKVEIPVLDRVLKQYAKNMLSTSIGGLYGLREVGNFAINWLIDGQTYGGGARFDGLYGAFAQQIAKEAQLIANKSERDRKAAEDEEKRRAKYDKMTPAQKKKFREEQKYRRPPNTISYADIMRGLGEIGTRLTASRFGVTDPIADAVLGTMQYIFDSDGRYDATLRNMMWSAFWTKKPVKRTPPEKPEKPKKKGR